MFSEIMKWEFFGCLLLDQLRIRYRNIMFQSKRVLGVQNSSADADGGNMRNNRARDLIYANLFTSIMGRIIDRSMISSRTLFAHMYVNAARKSSDMQISSRLCISVAYSVDNYNYCRLSLKLKHSVRACYPEISLRHLLARFKISRIPTAI